MKRYIFICFSVLLFSPIHAQWSVVGVPNFSSVRADFIFAAIAPNGEPYVVYRDGTDTAIISAGRVMRFDGSSWVNVGPRFSAENVYSTTMAFDKYGTPYVAYMDWADCYRATVKKFDGSSWIPVGVSGFTPGCASYTSIAFDTNNTPYIAFRDVGACGSSGPNGYRASVMKFDGSNWVYVGTPGFSTPGSGSEGALYTSLAVSKNNTLYVAYTDFSNGFRATVMTFDGSNWVNVGTGVISTGQTGSTSIAVDSHNMPCVGYVDVDNGGRATVMKFDGTNWVSVGSPGFTPGNAEYTSLTIDRNDRLYLAYEDYANGNKASVMAFDGSSWSTLGYPGFSATKAQYTSIAVDNNSGALYVAYEGYYDTATYTGTVMRYDITTKVKPIENNYSMGVYPNPSNRTITININTSIPKEEYILIIRNVTGNVAYSERVKDISGSFTKKIDLSVLPKGMYFVELQPTDQTSVGKHVAKVVLQ